MRRDLGIDGLEILHVQMAAEDNAMVNFPRPYFVLDETDQPLAYLPLLPGKEQTVKLGANIGYLKFTPRPTWNPF